MKRATHIFLQLVSLLLVTKANLFAQNYPVHITTQLVAPFSGYIPDYANPGEEKMKLLLLFTDFTKPQYNVKLKISIQGQGINIQSKSYFFDGPHTLQPGVPLELSGSDLYNLLNTQNLDFSGITRNQYDQKKVLPEGFYSVCITAYDYNNPTLIQVSNNACAQAWMVLSDPPFLNLPVCSSTVSITNPQQQTFSFTQMNMGSPNSAANTEYIFELWEIRPQGAVANNIVQTVPPIYSYTTNLTSVNYGITEPPLLPGMQYAWRVRAHAISGRDYFKNNGYSQVCTFTYGSALEDVNLNLNIHAQGVTQRQIKVWWDSLANFTSYKMEFRKAGSNGNWFPVETTNSHVRILDLEPQTTYEFHVQGRSSEYTSNYSPTVNATTQPIPNYQCGEIPPVPSSINFTPLQQANTHMIWQVGQFELSVTELQNNTSPLGIYSGYGKIKMPFIGNVYCSFNNVSVSNDQIVVQGKVNALTQGIDAWINENEPGTIQDGTVETDIHSTTPLTTGDILVNTGNGTVVVGGNTYTYTPSGTTIEDSNGNIFIVTADGQVINAGTAGSGHGAVPESKNYIVTDKGIVSFNASAKQLYGMDKMKYPVMANYYLTVRNLTSNSQDPVDWKSVMAQKYDVIDLNYQLQGGLKSDSILFISGTGTIYKPQGSGNRRQLYVVGGKPGDVQELFACYRFNKDSLVNIAKINIVSYRNEQNKVTFIPLGTGVTIDKNQMQKELNEIFKQSVASWEVNIAPAITAGDSLWDKDGNGRINVGSNIFSRYSEEMKAINKYVRSQTYYKKNEYFLVVTSKPTDSLSTGLLGEMPRGKNIGYIFTGTPTATVVAHELGHGAFALEHSFEGNATLPTGSMCLMDYNNGTELYKGKYWDYVHNPTTVIGLTEGDDDGAILDKDIQVLSWLDKIRIACKNNTTVTIPKGNINYLSTDITTSKNTYLAGIAFNYIHIAIYSSPLGSIQVNCKNRITLGTITKFDKNGQPINSGAPCIDIDGGSIKIETNPPLLLKLKSYLEGLIKEKNLIIFSNGYRPTSPDYLIFHLELEKPESNHTISKVDFNDYWGGIDDQFMNRIGTHNVVYADGHHSVSSSNHKTLQQFIASITSSANAAAAASVGSYPLPKVILDTSKYQIGFETRRINGMKAGDDLIKKINNGTVIFNKSTDVVDIVCHSYGFAYAQGIIEVLRSANIKIGRYYIIAPENACSGMVDQKSFEEIWQYGSNLGEPDEDLIYQQDGVAPQCAVSGLSAENRVFIPKQVNFIKSFTSCHTIRNFGWIFTNQKVGMPGYVSPRK